jgi:hypothetical protein
MKAILIAPLLNSNAVLPPMDDLVYLVDGVPTGGFSLVGNVPQPDTFTCFVLVHTAPATMDAMVASGDYVFVEEVAEGEPEIAALAAPNPPRDLPAPAALRIWLIQHGYSPALVAGHIPANADPPGLRRGLRGLHQVSDEEYQRAWH